MNIKELNIAIRPIQEPDIKYIADYWTKSDPEFLVGMGVDLGKLPSVEQLENMLQVQLATPLTEKKAFATIWLLNNRPVGHCNINNIFFGEEATMHLHLWNALDRQKGIGTELVKQSVELFFDLFELKRIICEPYAENPAPNKTLKKIGFNFEKRYVTIPGSLNFEQEVNRWVLEK